MAKLIYTYNCSLDGYIEDASGSIDWGVPSAQVHAFINDLERPVGTYLYGRRLYEVMAVWEDLPLGDEPPEVRDYGRLWRAAEKVVFSRTLDQVSSARTRIEREFDAVNVRRWVAESPSDVSIGGSELAGHAIRADLELLDERRFDNGVVYLRHGRRE